MGAATHVAVLRVDTVVPGPENGSEEGERKNGRTEWKDRVLMPQHG